MLEIAPNLTSSPIVASYGGKFFFLTFDEGGTGLSDTTEHRAVEYSVQCLDSLVARLVEDELAKLSCFEH